METIFEMLEWPEERFILMNSANTNRVATGEVLILRFRILKAELTHLGWNHGRTNIRPEETNDILKLMDLELSIP